MRVWLVDEQQGEPHTPLEAVLRQVAERAGGRMTLLGTGPLRPGLLTELRGWQLDLVVIREAHWPQGPEAQALLDLDAGVVVIAGEDSCERFLTLAETYPVGLVAPPGQPGDMWPALLATLAARRRHLQARAELARLQERLNDRIVIERAKGILVQRLGITEEDAYKRMRVISRRQRRQIRDIAQSLLDTESLLLPEVNGFFEDEAESGSPPRGET
jgi:response regulator NasT